MPGPHATAHILGVRYTLGTSAKLIRPLFAASQHISAVRMPPGTSTSCRPLAETAAAAASRDIIPQDARCPANRTVHHVGVRLGLAAPAIQFSRAALFRRTDTMHSAVIAFAVVAVVVVAVVLWRRRDDTADSSAAATGATAAATGGAATKPAAAPAVGFVAQAPASVWDGASSNTYTCAGTTVGGWCVLPVAAARAQCASDPRCLGFIVPPPNKGIPAGSAQLVATPPVAADGYGGAVYYKKVA
jgi:hypothetical protein